MIRKKGEVKFLIEFKEFSFLMIFLFVADLAVTTSYMTGVSIIGNWYIITYSMYRDCPMASKNHCASRGCAGERRVCPGTGMDRWL